VRIASCGFFLGLAAFSWGCSGHPQPPPQNDNTGNDGAVSTPDSSPVEDSGVGVDVTAGDVTGGDGSGDDASGTGDGNANAGDVEAGRVFPPACVRLNSWSTTIARVASIAPAGFDRFGAISATALTVAWTTSAGEIYVADRGSTTAAFGTPALLNPGTTALANGRVALMPTGNELVATLADGSSFVTFYRTSPSGSWSPTFSTEFETIAAMAKEFGGTFAEPVVSASGESLFYLLAAPNEPPAFYESPWDASLKQWATGAALPNGEFYIGSAATLRRPTGASSDGLTLFFFDEAAGNERGAWRVTPTSPFTTFADLTATPEAAPVDDCSVIYFHGSDAMGQGLFTGSGP
jgi:hypothetical protein